MRMALRGWALLLAMAAGCGRPDVATLEARERGSPLYRRASAAERSGDIEEAIRLYNRILIEEPRSFLAHFQLATLLHDHAENYIGAIHHYQRYLELRPEADKSPLARERMRVAEQLLAPQILRRVGDSVQGLTQAHLLQETDRLQRVISGLEGEKSALVEERDQAMRELQAQQAETTRLRELLNKIRVGDASPDASGSLINRVGAAARASEDEPAATRPMLDAQTVRGLRQEAADLIEQGRSDASRRSASPPRPEAAPVVAPAPAPEPPRVVEERQQKARVDEEAISALSLFGREDRRARRPAVGDEPRTYVVQPGDTLFRVSEKFYGDATKWRRIQEANRTRIDPDGRIRAGQIIVIP